MFLKSLQLQNFRNYPKNTFSFSFSTTLIIGPNTAGKSNLLESILILATGKSSKADKDIDAIRFEEEMARVKGVGRKGESEEFSLEVMFTKGQVLQVETPLKKYLLNGVSKRRADFAGVLSAVLFSPSDVDIITGSPSLRRMFLDDTLEAVDLAYRRALNDYIKAIRQRNALLEVVQETGRRNEKQFEYWDDICIKNGSYITEKRKEFIDFVNNSKKDVFSCTVIYDHSIISKERLAQYEKAEEGSGVTLVGPHRDDFYIEFSQNKDLTHHNVKQFGSRGQQRLVILQLKIIQMDFIEKHLKERPVLLLDDIFSELDQNHIDLVLSLIGSQQTIITTTHEELVDKGLLKTVEVIELKK